ncbi:MAG: DUF4252 domain-containing protein [Bacteroidetes bacterium]|nr:DUF4252 domain-containing protein [Bacteroidota bacterium]MBU1680721.1 DUF4252 domain-containing protein [Bacteroidota bacterium]MBU2505964.1 DUF4252 domain-containing protein [Bacteroidota bacterium]
MKAKSLVLFVVFAAGILFAQKSDYSKYDGYIEFGDLSSFESGEMVTEVMIEAHLLKMVSKMTSEQEPELSSLLSGLKLVKVNAFEIDEKNMKTLQKKADVIDKELMSKNWDRIVKTRSKKESASVYIKTSSGDKITGLVVISLNGKKAAFVNIVGDINLETIGKLGSKFDIPALDNVTDKSK